MKRFSSYVYANEKAFIPEDAVNVRRKEDDAKKCCNARTRSARRRHVMDRKGLGQGAEESNEIVEMVNRNK